MARRNPALAIQTQFATFEDPRSDRTRLHVLMDLVVIAICAVLCGADGWEDIAKYGRAKHAWLISVLDLEEFFANQAMPAPLAAYRHELRKREEEAEQRLAELPPLDIGRLTAAATSITQGAERRLRQQEGEPPEGVEDRSD